MSFGIPVRNGLGVGLLASTFLSSLRIGGRPAMSLDFIGTNSLDSRVTFTRATTATFVGSNGLIQTAAIDAPRFDYDPVTLTPRGLLIEEARTNLLTYSDQYDNIIWTKNSATITANTTVSPDGTANADTITAAAATSNHSAQYAYVFLAGAYTQTSYLKQGTNRYAQLRYGGTVAANAYANFDLQAGVVGTIGAGLTSASITAAGNGWYRCSVSVTSAAVASGFGIFMVTGLTAAPAESWAAVGTETMSLAGSQLEVGAFATSYIPTTTLAVARNADVATMTGTNFSSWYNQTEGTLVCIYQLSSGSGAARGAWRISDNTTTNTMDFRPNGGNCTVTSGGASQVDIYPGGGTIGAVNKNAFAYKLNDFAATTNGSAAVTDAVGTVPAVTQLNIGALLSVTGQILNGHIRSITYYNTRLPNTTLRTLTA